MKTSKRRLSLLLALTMVLSLMGNLSVSAFADEPQPAQKSSVSTEETIPSAPANQEKGETGKTGGDAADNGTTPAGGAAPDGAASTEGTTPTTPTTPTENEGQDGEGTTTGGKTTPVAVPTRKEGFPATAAAKVKTGTAYLLEDLQKGNVFQGVDGKELKPTDYYYERSTDGGATWGARTRFEEALFGATLIQITENTAGVYTYRFYASHDGTNFSDDTWTLTLTVEDNPTMNFSFYVGKDYTGGYPIIKLYNVTTDSEGNETLGAEIENCFLYSNFTDTLPEGEEAYNAADGKLVSNYQMFYASLTSGRYAYRAFAQNSETGAYDVKLGGMTLDLPTEKNVDGGAGGGSDIYLQCNSFYTTSRKSDNKTYFTAEEYDVKVDCPTMKTSCEMGTPYTKGNYGYHPTVLYAAGNACLYNLYAYPKNTEEYTFSQAINQTFRASYSAGTKTVTINTNLTLTVTVPKDADFGLYFQWNNFNTTKVEPKVDWAVDGDTKTAVYTVSKGNSNYTWRLSDAEHVTQAGWLSSQSTSAAKTFTFAEGAATDRVSHDFSKLGTQTSKRDEADLQINLDPSGYETLSGTTRVRAYRHWQLINSDAGNIMVEPDYHWNVLSGNATFQTVNGGNTTANWADVTPGTEDSVIAVYYDSVDVNPGDYRTHGGLYPATNPERVGVIVVGGTGVSHGTADADVDFNMEPGATTTRSMDWDYNYDTWFYGANETNPALDFAVKSTGNTTVEYAIVTTTSAMVSTVSGFTAVSAGTDDRYTVPLNGFNTANTNGGTVIIKMTDETGVSYRLVRVAKVTVTAENASNPSEDIMPGDEVKLNIKGMYRSVNKISGIFNPTTFKPTYYAGETKCEGKLGQYQKMDNATYTVTVPEDVTFEEGKDTTEYAFTNGYTFGSMYAAANPFAFLYNITDTGVGTNFNAVTVNYYMNHYADAVVTVSRKVTYTVKFDVADDAGKAVADVTVSLLDRGGKEVAPKEDGTFTLGYGPYTYLLKKDGYVCTRSAFTLGSADAGKVKDGVLTISATMPKAGANGWDGTTKTEPKQDANGVYQIGTAAELAWFAANGSNASAKLTADIELAGYDWTPLNKFYGTFDGCGHTVNNLYINSTRYPVGLFGYLKTGAIVSGLGVIGNVTCTAKSNAQAGGIAGYVEDKAVIIDCYSAVNVTSAKHGGGIAGYTDTAAVITNSYASGDVATTAANECYLGGIAASYYNQFAGATLTNCYSIGKVTGTGGNASYLGGLACIGNEKNFVDSFYLDGTVTKESPKNGIIGKGTALSKNDMLEKLDATAGSDLTTALVIKWKGQYKTDSAAVNKAVEKINAIGTVTLDSKAAIEAARAAYDALSDAQKSMIPAKTLKLLTNAEAQYAKLVDQAAAEAVTKQVQDIGKVSMDSKKDITAAREAYEGLTEAQKKLVSADTVKALENAEAALEAAEKIDAIGKVDKNSKDKLDEAQKAYDALTDEQKELLSKDVTKTLTEAKATYNNIIQHKDRGNAGSGSKSSGTNAADTAGKDKTQSADTADNSHLTLWLSGALLSAAALALLAKKRRQDA